MNELITIFQEVKGDFEALHIPCGIVREIAWTNRMSRCRGNCRKREDGYVIHISQRIWQRRDLVKNTVAHELLHTVPGCFNHGKQFRACAQMLASYGYDVSIRYEPEPFETRDLMVFECQRCHTRTTRSRSSAFTRHPERYRHQGCGGTFRKVSS